MNDVLTVLSSFDMAPPPRKLLIKQGLADAHDDASLAKGRADDSIVTDAKKTNVQVASLAVDV